MERPNPKGDICELWSWLDSFVAREVSEAALTDDFDVSEAASAPDEGTADLPSSLRVRLFRREQKAIMRGFYRLASGEEGAWDDLCLCLTAEESSRDFRQLVAALIKANILHSGGKVPKALNRQRTLDRVRHYKELLSRCFQDLGKLKYDEQAHKLTAIDLVLEAADAISPSEFSNTATLAADIERMAAQVKSVTSPKRGTDKAASGSGAAILKSATEARIIAEP